MVKTTALTALLAMLGTAAASTPAPRVTALSITHNGARSKGVSGDETAAMCSRFRPTMGDVRSFFAKARRASVREYTHDLAMSRCYAGGRIAFADGVSGRWFIDLERRGALMLRGPRTDANTIYYYCKRCASPPFDEVYDPDKDG